MALRNINKKDWLFAAVILMLTIYCLSLIYWREVETPCSHGLLATNPTRKWRNALLFFSFFLFSEMHIHDKRYYCIVMLLQAAMLGLICNEYSDFSEDWGVWQMLNFWTGFIVAILIVKVGHKLNEYKKTN